MCVSVGEMSTEIESLLQKAIEKIEKNNQMPDALKACRIAQIYVSYGKHAESIEYYEKSLVLVAIIVSNMI